MPSECSDFLQLFCVPYLSDSLVSTHSKVRTPLAPTDGGDLVVLAHFAQFLNFTVVRVPYVNSALQTHR